MFLLKDALPHIITVVNSYIFKGEYSETRLQRSVSIIKQRAFPCAANQGDNAHNGSRGTAIGSTVGSTSSSTPGSSTPAASSRAEGRRASHAATISLGAPLSLGDHEELVVMPANQATTYLLHGVLQLVLRLHKWSDRRMQLAATVQQQQQHEQDQDQDQAASHQTFAQLKSQLALSLLRPAGDQEGNDCVSVILGHLCTACSRWPVIFMMESERPPLRLAPQVRVLHWHVAATYAANVRAC